MMIKNIKKEKLVYGQNQLDAKSNFRRLNVGFVPIKAIFAGTKHSQKIYNIIYRKSKYK